MTTVLAHSPLPPPTPPSPAGWTLWGANPRTLHDRVWALRAFQVIRPGGTPPDPRGPRQYLLLEPDQMVDFSPRVAMDRQYWSRARATRVRVVEKSGHSYAEAVDCDGAGNLVKIRRDYSSVASTTARCWLTTDPRVARQWHEVGSRPRAWAALNAWLGTENAVCQRVEGRLGRADHPEQAMAWLEAMPGDTTDIEHAFEGVYLFQPGVWAHESATIDPRTRFAGRALIGAGVDLRNVSVVIGPVILGDENPVENGAFDWGQLESPTHRLLPRPRLRRGWVRRASKRAFDVTVAAGALACFLPLFPLVMLLIYLEDGRPFFFAHTRQTRGGRDFPCYKFRTMIKDAERAKELIRQMNQSDGAHFFIKNDPRLLKVGKWLRRFQIDEIPQLWNILLGHMSLVGPRPSPDKENQYCPAWREARLSVRPGLTGLWQVRRTREPQTDFQEWIRYDLEYVQRESWRLDLWIIAETVRTVVLGGRSTSKAQPPQAAGATHTGPAPAPPALTAPPSGKDGNTP